MVYVSIEDAKSGIRKYSALIKYIVLIPVAFNKKKIAILNALYNISEKKLFFSFCSAS